MDSLEVLGHVVAVLDELRIDHMLVGAFSSNAYGVARATKDVDFVVACDAVAVLRIAEALGQEYRLDRQMQFETITNTVRNVITHVPTGFDIELFRLSDDPHHQERLRRRRRGMVGGLARGVWIPTAEDVIVQKLRWHRDKDLGDVRNVIAVRSGELDWEYIRRWAGTHGTLELLERLVAALPTLDDLADD
jgi:hypothetical protein